MKNWNNISAEDVGTYGDLANTFLQTALMAKNAADAKKAAQAKADLDKQLAIQKANADIALAQQVEKDTLAANLAMVNKSGNLNTKTTPSATSYPPPATKTGLGTGAIIGIVVGGLAVIGIVIFAIKTKGFKK